MAKTHCRGRIQGRRHRQRLTTVRHSHQRATQPIGVFDSGVGGLSILQALRAELPAEHFVYLADSGHAPYGERDEAHVLARARVITRHLRQAWQVKALVIACNTATAAAGQALRAEHPDLPIVGVEPALKPAVAHSHTGHIGVMATRATLGSAKFAALLASQPPTARFSLQACDGLAEAIERQDTSKIIALCDQYTLEIGSFGLEKGQIDTLVLGCTHYPFAGDVLRHRLGPSIRLIDTGAPVARHTRQWLAAQHVPLQPASGAGAIMASPLTFLSTGCPATLAAAAQRWLAVDAPVTQVAC